ncbi:unnamed protein product [Fusarium venenatum]|uniref:Uncharacterized protein n=1 Tax=Fusarium venenatum TaxID=56646 RepID=A0A2L2TTF9_9HYPO|nr:uncharacterized protein FVRRES_08874 [Fusarium venenatum]CEI68797.1 unnamed protein product [Fusarium venenatum]
MQEEEKLTECLSTLREFGVEPVTPTRSSKIQKPKTNLVPDGGLWLRID